MQCLLAVSPCCAGRRGRDPPAAACGEPVARVEVPLQVLHLLLLLLHPEPLQLRTGLLQLLKDELHALSTLQDVLQALLCVLPDLLQLL